MKLPMSALEPLWQQLMLAAPKALLVVVILLLGLIASVVLRRVARWLVRRSGLETLAERAGVAKIVYAVGARRGVAELLGSLASLSVWLLTLAAVADVLKLDAVSAVVALAVRYLPRLLAAAALLLGGMAVASLVRNLISGLGDGHTELEDPSFVAQLAYYVILTVTVTLAADQAGLQTDIVEYLLLILVALGVGGLALSFALGARPVFRNIASAHYYGRLIQPGDRVRVGEVEGVAVRFSALALVLQRKDGEQIIVPCDQLLSSQVHVQPLTNDQVSDSFPTSQSGDTSTS